MSKLFNIHDWHAKQKQQRLEENSVVAKGDGLEITQDEMDKLHRDGRVRLKDGSLLAFMKEDDIDEASTTGTGASFTAGTGAAYATPRAFG